MVHHVNYWLCDKCKSRHSTRTAAAACENRLPVGKIDGLEVGSLVETHRDYGWADVENDEWIIFRTREESVKWKGYNTHLSNRLSYSPIYVIVAITDIDHHVTYHLYCPMNVDGKARHVWTRTMSHITPKLIDPERAAALAHHVPNILARNLGPSDDLL